jgi:hypothetical protein
MLLSISALYDGEQCSERSLRDYVSQLAFVIAL